VNPEAYEAYLKGRFHWNRREADDLQMAIGHFDRAIQIDSGYAAAFAGLASTYVILPEWGGVQQKDAFPRAETAARKALELDATSAEAHAVLGLLACYRWDWVVSEREFRRSLELDPNYPTAHQWYGNMLRTLGRLDESLEQGELALKLDPLSYMINVNVGITLFGMGQYDRSMDQLRKTLQLYPDLSQPHGNMGIIFEARHQYNEAIAEYQKAISLGGSDWLGDLGRVYALAGNGEKAREIINELKGLTLQGSPVSSMIATVYFGLGDVDRTFEWLDRAYQEQEVFLYNLKWYPPWSALRSDPRFKILLVKMGIEP
jgi:tetratricopeptide (TPR) repeat protein